MESLIGSKAVKHTPQIRSDLQRKYELMYSHQPISNRVAAYMGILGFGIQKHIENAINQGNKTFEIKGTLTEITGAYPFEIFRPYLLDVAQAICPGIQISFGEPKRGRFLAHDMIYHPIRAILPSQPSITFQSGLSAKDILYDIISGGRTTGHMRYPHMYLDMKSRIKQMPKNASFNILVLGVGLIEDPSGSVQCPQLYELGAMGTAQITILDNDPELLAILKNNLFSKNVSKHPLRYDGNVLTNLCQVTSFVSPDDYKSLCGEMFVGMGRYVENPHVTVVEGDLSTYTCQPNTYDFIVATSSLGNVYRYTDEDPIETKPMVNILSRYVTLLKTKGVFYFDEPTLTLLEERLGEGSINNVILPQIKWESKSDVSLTRFKCPVEKKDGLLVINSLIRNNGEWYLSPVVSHDIYALMRGKALLPQELPTEQRDPLIAHMRKSVRFLPKYVEKQASSDVQQID